MKKCVSPFLFLAFAGMMFLSAAPAIAQGTVVYDSIPSPTPPNVPSHGFQCCATAEIGDEVKLEVDTPRRTGYTTVLMSSWSLHSNYPTMSPAGYSHPITLNIYVDAASALAHTPVKTVTQSFVIPWRPEADPTCPGGTAWRAADTNCYNGFAFTIAFDLRALNYDLPEQFIYGIAYNTNTWGYAPIGAPGPYESLNVGLNSTPPVTVGTDVDPDGVYINYQHAAFYTDGGAGGVGTFRLDTGWAPYTPAVQFTTFALPTTVASCKNGAWQNLVRSDFTSFKNQGACVSYVQTGM
ncbi:MAG: hypothetical protein ABIS29_05120 [Vicinamibacterales bacterium]